MSEKSNTIKTYAKLERDINPYQKPVTPISKESILIHK